MPRVQQIKTGQMVITLPRKLAIATGIQKGDEIKFVINSKGRLELVKEND
jgi:bifunctional DNA-binding transcriptional regulator/antitoxin component of YhaV-PrlF toxin-antitoxin module